MPGKTNLWLSRISAVTFAAWDYSVKFFPVPSRVLVTGNLKRARSSRKRAKTRAAVLRWLKKGLPCSFLGAPGAPNPGGSGDRDLKENA